MTNCVRVTTNTMAALTGVSRKRIDPMRGLQSETVRERHALHSLCIDKPSHYDTEARGATVCHWGGSFYKNKTWKYGQSL